jgi:hypothetical protein
MDDSPREEDRCPHHDPVSFSREFKEAAVRRIEKQPGWLLRQPDYS